MVPCGDWNDPARTMMGAAQEAWLAQGLASDPSRWQVIAQQVMMAPFDDMAGAERRVSMHQWSGYPAARDRLLNTIARTTRNRTVVLTGDIHSNWVNELRSSFSRPGSPTVAAEFVGSSISSGGDGNDRSAAVDDRSLPENPHVKWQNGRRGYFTCEVGAEEWRTSYKTVPYVSRPDAPLTAASAWLLTQGRPGIQAV